MDLKPLSSETGVLWLNPLPPLRAPLSQAVEYRVVHAHLGEREAPPVRS